MSRKTCKGCGTEHGQRTKGCHACYMREVYYKRPENRERRRKNSKEYYENCDKTDRRRKQIEYLSQPEVKERYREYQREFQRKRRDEIKQIIRRAKDRPCADCGVKYPPRVMDLHHRDPALKKFNLASRKGASSPDAYRAEIAKCDVVCSNCHRLRHATINED